MSQDPATAPEPPSVPAPAPVDPWTQMLDEVRQRFPSASEGVVFCILKLQQDPQVRLRDFKAEADLHGIQLSGRSYHSARVLLGLEPPPVRKPRAAPAARVEPEPAPRRVAIQVDADTPAIAALRQFEAARAGEMERLRAAIGEVLAIVDRALAAE